MRCSSGLDLGIVNSWAGHITQSGDFSLVYYILVYVVVYMITVLSGIKSSEI